MHMSRKYKVRDQTKDVTQPLKPCRAKKELLKFEKDFSEIIHLSVNYTSYIQYFI